MPARVPLPLASAVLLIGLASCQMQSDYGLAFPREPAHCRPYYPSESHYRGEGGVVDVSFRVNPDGSTRDVDVAAPSGHPSLETASLVTMRRCNFAQGEMRLPPGQMLYRVEFTFTPPADIKMQWLGLP